MAVHNAAFHVDAKIEGLLAHDYPAELLEIIVVSDGSTMAPQRACMPLRVID